ncbi:MAG TPA: lysophospholipid acyltransferase family protein [Syntrophales bacterium]|nr:lysophospholipid acyltransferase family protein [Syntrophales bacterium]
MGLGINAEQPIKKAFTTSLILLSFGLIPLGIRKIIFETFFWLFYHLSVKHRLIALSNLRRAYPEKDMEEITRIAKSFYRHLAIVAAEFFELPSITKQNLGEWVEFEGLENLEKALEQKKGALSIVAHFGNWELMTVALPLGARPMSIVYRPLDNATLDNLTAWMRTKDGNTLISKGGAGRKITRLLAENRIIGILSDQNVDKYEGVFVDFFGSPACTSVGLAALALRTDAPVLPAFMARMPSGKYKFIIQPPVEITRTDDYESDLLVNTQRFTKLVEDMVRKYPDQWFWIHQRWKTKPWQ